jgi:hypothetical protein
MKVKELITALAAHDQEAEVVVQDHWEMMTLHAVENLGYVPTRAGKTLAINAVYCERPEARPTGKDGDEMTATKYQPRWRRVWCRLVHGRYHVTVCDGALWCRCATCGRTWEEGGL